MNGTNERDEMLERLWQLQERGSSTREELQRALRGRYRDEDLAALSRDALVTEEGDAISLTPTGSAHAQRLIRSHRIGERLIHDVLGREFESAACEFEHIINSEIVDGICTLLGHPRECPHGFPIPEGECCRVSARYAQRIIVPLTELPIGQTGRVAYVYSQSDQQLHRLTSLQIRPGSLIKLHQSYPSYVIECEGASIALDDEVAGNINVWIEGEAASAEASPPEPAEQKGLRPSFVRLRRRFGAPPRR
jgi:DtxR family transcriptional regulator, Mn-dependent transcriptional regulator